MLKILVPVDGSKYALRAVEHVVALAAEMKNPPKVHLLNVQQRVTFGHVKKFVKKKALEEYYREEAEKVLGEAAERLAAGGVDHSRHVRAGRVAEAIAEYIQEKGCDRVVMATRGHGAVPRLLLGSVAAKVVSLVAVPVTLVK